MYILNWCQSRWSTVHQNIEEVYPAIVFNVSHIAYWDKVTILLSSFNILDTKGRLRALDIQSQEYQYFI